MGDRRPPKRSRHKLTNPARPDVFAECGLDRADFVVVSGGGKSFLANQRIVWMRLTHRPSGRTASGKIGTTKKGYDRSHDELLRILLRSFRRS
jgi:hypothetical protein